METVEVIAPALRTPTFVGVGDVLEPAYQYVDHYIGSYGYGEDLVQVVVIILILGVIDQIIKAMKLTGRFFILHAIINTGVVLVTLPDVIAILSDPLKSMLVDQTSQLANSLIIAIHLYHMLAFRLSAADIFHHLMFVFILGGLGLLLKNQFGILGSWPCFILSGLPGGIDYYMLFAVKNGWMESMTEKRINTALNVWVRAPGTIIQVYNLWINHIYGTFKPIPGMAFIMTLCAALYYYNGQLYSQQVVGNYHARLALMKGSRSIKKTQEEHED